jgi:hypothetical protein
MKQFIVRAIKVNFVFLGLAFLILIFSERDFDDSNYVVIELVESLLVTLEKTEEKFLWCKEIRDSTQGVRISIFKILEILCLENIGDKEYKLSLQKETKIFDEAMKDLCIKVLEYEDLQLL